MRTENLKFLLGKGFGGPGFGGPTPQGFSKWDVGCRHRGREVVADLGCHEPRVETVVQGSRKY
jgi:hypothetical protein